MQPRMPEPGRRTPADADVVELGEPDVHRPVDQHIKTGPAPGAELKNPDAPLDAVIQHHRPHATGRGQVARVPLDHLAAEIPVHAITHPPLTSIVCPVTNEASGPARNDTTAASSSGVPRRLRA